jgi:Electron transfer DM13
MSFIGDLGSAILGTAYELRIPLAIAAVALAVVLLLVARRLGLASVARRHPIASAAGVAVIALVAVPVGWYLVSPIFIRTELREAPIAAAADPSPTAPPAKPAPTPTPTPPEDATPGPTATLRPTATPVPTPTPWAPAPARSGRFVGTDDFHFGRGTAILSETAPGEWVVRFEDFSVRNGPDLFVYLSPDPDGYAKGAIEVARLKATDGSFNTRVPGGTDVSGVRSVLIWCKQFSHLFAVAALDG